MTGNPPSGGIWAPCLTWSDGLFYLIFTDAKTWCQGPFKDVSNYLVTAESIEGPWSEPIYLNSSGFDPSLFHDDDGRKWLVNMEWDYRRQDRKAFSGILLQQYDHAAGKLIGAESKIWTGTDIGAVEGPHLYKVNGWYYLVCAEGGTEYGHAVSVARSRSIAGPYEVHPDNPLCSSRGDRSLYLQKAGHGSWCRGGDGRWFLAFLAGRPLPGTDRCVLGRETALAELVWKNDWPYLANGGNEPPNSIQVPWDTGVRDPEDVLYTFSDDSSDRFAADFMTLRLPQDPQWFSLSERPGHLRVRGAESLVSRHRQGLIARRQTSFDFDAETCLEFNPESFQQMAGLIYRYDEDNWFYLRVSWDEECRSRVLGILAMDAGRFTLPLGSKELALSPGPVHLRAQVRGSDLHFFWTQDSGGWRGIGARFDASILSDDYHTLGFTGAFIGMACQDLRAKSVFADFSYFKYKEYPEL